MIKFIVILFYRLAENYGLKLVMKERFSTYFKRMKNEGRGLLGRMQAMEVSFCFINMMSLVKKFLKYDKYLKSVILLCPSSKYIHCV